MRSGNAARQVNNGVFQQKQRKEECLTIIGRIVCVSMNVAYKNRRAPPSRISKEKFERNPNEMEHGRVGIPWLAEPNQHRQRYANTQSVARSRESTDASSLLSINSATHLITYSRIFALKMLIYAARNSSDVRTHRTRPNAAYVCVRNFPMTSVCWAPPRHLTYQREIRTPDRVFFFSSYFTIFEFIQLTAHKSFSVSFSWAAQHEKKGIFIVFSKGLFFEQSKRNVCAQLMIERPYKKKINKFGTHIVAVTASNRNVHRYFMNPSQTTGNSCKTV